MKKLFNFNFMFRPVALIVIMANISTLSGQTGKEQSSSIPENIYNIFKASCFSCHGSNGRMMPMARVNFAKWEEYSSAKQAEKASKICYELTNELMPPKYFRKSNPELIPTREQIESICKWAESLKPKERVK